MSTIVLLVVLAVIVLWVIGAYNGLISLKNQVANAWKQIDVQLKRRHDLIPNLVNTVKGAMDYERGTLEAVIAARNKAVSATGVKDTARAEGELTQALGRLFALTEAYPELKANQNVLQLQEQAGHLPDVARRGTRQGVARGAVGDRGRRRARGAEGGSVA
jgi:LemA protein